MRKLLSTLTLVLFSTLLVMSSSAQCPAPTAPLSGTTNVCSNGTTTLTAPSLPTGGTVSSSGNYRIHTFTSSGTFTVPTGFSGTVEVLVIAGGGGGGTNGGGGGGAGGVLYNASYSVSSGSSIAVTVGAGGAGATTSAPGSSGGNSIFGTLTASGGGGGASRDAGGAATSGGSGGGGAGTYSGNSGGATAGTGTSGQGFSGGNGTGDLGCNSAGGGGGGAGGVGTAGASTLSGNGGAGISYSISGVAKFYAAGGGGGLTCNNNTRGAGGSSIGGNGGGNLTLGTSGAANTGSGGGGGGAGLNSSGSGGSGVVIIRYINYSTGTWSSSNTSVATVNASGLVTGISAGSATISLTTSSCTNASTQTVTVYSPVTPTITASGATTFCNGGSVTLSATTGNAWVQKASFSLSTGNTVAFSIGNKGYIGTGIINGNPVNDFWEYDPSTNVWTQKASFGGAGRGDAVGFSIGNKGYIGTGSSTVEYKDFWQYDPSLNQWTQKADFGGLARHNAVGFSIGGKGYIGTGTKFNNVQFQVLPYNDFWEYDPTTDTWTQKADFGGALREDAVGFSIGSKGYLGTGTRNTGGGTYQDYTDFWEYDPSINTWSQKADFGGGARSAAVGFSINNKGYVGTGRHIYFGTFGWTTQRYNDFWEFDPAANSWINKAAFGGVNGQRDNAVGLSIGGKGYIGTSYFYANYNDFWEYTPSLTYSWSPGGQTTQSITVNTTGSYAVSVTNSVGCTATSATTVVTLNTPPTATINGTTSVCQNAITNITFTGANGTTPYTFTYKINGGASQTVSTSSGSSVTVSVPTTTSGTYTYTLTNVQDAYCSQTQSGTATVTVNFNTVSAASSTPNVCINSGLSITHTTTGATGIGAATGLPTGVTASFASNTITISGTPSAAGTFNYSIPLTGGCGSVSASGTITVRTNSTVSAASSTPSVCINSAISTITHTTTGATSIGAATGLPSGVSASFASNTITISGTPTQTGVYNYTIPVIGCSSVSATGTITVNPKPTATISGTTSVYQNYPAPLITFTGANGAAPYTFAYKINNGANQTVTTSSSNSVTVSVPTSTVGTYAYSLVSVQDASTAGCSLQAQSGTATVTVNALPLDPVASQTACAGTATAPVNFTGTATAFRWTNDNPSIGLAATGTGNIASFTAINNSSSPVIANITATPLGNTYAYIPNFISQSVSVINVATNAVVATIPVGSNPYGVGISPDGSKVYVTNQANNNVSVISTTTNTVVATIGVNTWPRGVAVTPDGTKAYVANYSSSTISVINTSNNSVSTLGNVSNPIGIAFSPDGTKLYIANYGNNTLGVMNTSTNSITATVNVGTHPYAVAVNPAGTRVYVTNKNSNSVTVINTSNNTAIATITVGSQPSSVAVSPDGNTVYVANEFTPTVSVIDANSNAVVSTISVGGHPEGLSFNQDGSNLYVANANDFVSVVNTNNNTVSANINVGSNPYSLGNFVMSAPGAAGPSQTFSITVYPTPNASISGATSICQNGTSPLITFTGSHGQAPYSFTYNINGGANQVVTTTAGNSVTVSVPTASLGTYTYNLVSVQDANCSQGQSGSATVTVNTPPSATISYDGSPYCSNGGTATVTRIGTAGGSYSSTTGLSINGNTGDIDLSASTPGTYTVTYNYSSDGCSGQATSQITVTAAPLATISYGGSPYCANGGTATVTRTGTAGGTFSSSTGLSIDASTGDITPGTSTAGTYTVTYTIAAAGGCAQFSTNTSVTIVDPTNLSISYAGNSFCQTGNYLATRTGVAGGIYSSDPSMSVNATTGTIFPAASTPGVHTITYSVNFPTGCTSSATTTVTILPTPTITVGTAPMICSSATPSTALLPYTATTGSPVTYSITANAQNPMPNYVAVVNASLPGSPIPVIVPAGTPGATYYFDVHVTTANGCVSAGRYVFKVTVASQATIGIAYNGSPYCNTGVAGVTQTGATGGTYTSSPTGLSMNSTTGLINLGYSQIGSYTVTYTVTLNGCTYTTTAPVTITALPTITAGNAPAVCFSANASIALLPYTTTTGNPTTYSLSVGTNNPMPGFTPVVDAPLPASPISIAIPAGTAAGTYTFNLRVKNAQGCTSPGVYVVSVTIAGSNTTIVYNSGQPICQTGVALVTRTGAAGGTYSSDTSLNINSSTGTIYPASSTVGTHTVTYTLVTANCTFSTTTDVTIVPLPKVTIGTIAPVCVSDNAQTASVPYSVTASTPVSYSITVGATNPMLGYVAVTDATIINPIVVNIPAGTAPGTYSFYLTLKSAGGCISAKYTFFVSVKAMPTATIAYNSSPYSTTITAAAVTFSGTTDGIYSSTTGLHLNTSTGSIFPSTSTPGIYTVTYTVSTATNCAATATAQVTIYTPGAPRMVTTTPVKGSVAKTTPLVSLTDKIVIAPNPVERMLTINTTGIDGTMQLRITNATGSVLVKEIRFSSSFKLDMSSYAAGVYIVEVMNEKSGEITRKKIVKL